MHDGKVEPLLNDLSLANPAGHALVQAVRETVRVAVPDVAEKVMYGGIMFLAPMAFCGVFAYAAHVSVEFGRGRELDDPHRVLEGNGKQRRHIKLRALADLEARHLRDYIEQAHAIGRSAESRPSFPPQQPTR